MLRTRNDQPTLWDAIIPSELLELPELLAKVDRLLDDERFFAPFVPYFHPSEGRPSIPMETYLAADVPQVPLPVGVRAAVRRGGRLVDLAAVLSDPAGCPRAASDHVDEDHHPLRAAGRSSSTTRCSHRRPRPSWCGCTRSAPTPPWSRPMSRMRRGRAHHRRSGGSGRHRRWRSATGDIERQTTPKTSRSSCVGQAGPRVGQSTTSRRS
jgi:hypothetical protein